MKILRAAERIAQPWKNGGGVTREVALLPQGAGFDDFDWRVSIADVQTAGPFSRFDNIDRTLMILRGRLHLAFADREVTLDPGSAPFVFPGDAACSGTPLGGPVTDLNVMTRRGRCAAKVECLASAKLTAAGMTVLVALAPTGVRHAEQTLALERFDAVLIDTPSELAVDGSMLAIAICHVSDCK